MKREPTPASDFRYGTGAAKVGWPAVGEPIRTDDLMALLEFLVPPRPDADAAYRRKLRHVRRSLEDLLSVGHLATKLTLGNQVQELEEAVQKYLSVKHALLLTNATAGFEIAYKMAGLQPGDEVIVPAITFIATIVYPLSIGAKVVFADLDPRTINMDPADVARKITPQTRMIVPVHIAGWPVEMASIMRLARQHDLVVLEDAAHGFGGRYRGRMLGTIGHFGAYSFHEVKNINALGEGGILVSNTKHGRQFSKARFVGLDLTKQIPHWLYDVTPIEGMRGSFVAGNHSTTEIQAVALHSQLKRIDQIIAARRKTAQTLNRRFENVPGVRGTPMDHGTTQGTHHLYQLQIDPQVVGADIQALKKKLTERGVTQIAHFGPLYQFELLRRLGYDARSIAAQCPICEELFYRRYTHLPLYGLSPEQVKYLGDAVIDSVAELRRGT